jgi:hypothetical protein
VVRRSVIGRSRGRHRSAFAVHPFASARSLTELVVKRLAKPILLACALSLSVSHDQASCGHHPSASAKNQCKNILIHVPPLFVSPQTVRPLSVRSRCQRMCVVLVPKLSILIPHPAPV